MSDRVVKRKGVLQADKNWPGQRLGMSACGRTVSAEL